MPGLELHCGQTSFSRDGIDVSYYDPEDFGKGGVGENKVTLRQIVTP